MTARAAVAATETEIARNLQAAAQAPDLLVNQQVAEAPEEPVTPASFTPVWVSDTLTITTHEQALAYVREHALPGFERLIQHGRVQPDYSLRFEHAGTILIGDSLQELKPIINVLDAHGIVVSYRTPAKWSPVRECLIQLKDIEEGDGRAEEAAEWLEIYYAECAHEGPTFEAVRQRAPFHKDGRMYVNRSAMSTFVARNLSTPTRPAEIARLLRRLGFDKAPENREGQIAARDGEQVVTARYMASEVDFNPATWPRKPPPDAGQSDDAH